MTDDADKDRLFEEATDLIIRLQSDQANPVARDLVALWRARGPDHEAAWTEAAEIHGMAGKILEDRQRAGQSKAGLSRRDVILTGLAGFAALGAGTAFGPTLLMRARADHVTTTAELSRIDLPDGSIVTLGPNSAMRSEFTLERRRVELLAGMAFFEVAKDTTRPFQAVADDLTCSALGTAFDLSIDAGLLTVSVEHGLVDVSAPGASLTQGERLAQGDWLTLDGSTWSVERGRRDADQVAAWRQGMIVADRETMASVVARIARWQPGRVVIANPSYGARRVSGVFDLHDPVAALDAVVHPHGGKVRQLSPWLTVVSSL